MLKKEGVHKNKAELTRITANNGLKVDGQTILSDEDSLVLLKDKQAVLVTVGKKIKVALININWLKWKTPTTQEHKTAVNIKKKPSSLLYVSRTYSTTAKNVSLKINWWMIVSSLYQLNRIFLRQIWKTWKYLSKLCLSSSLNSLLKT